MGGSLFTRRRFHPSVVVAGWGVTLNLLGACGTAVAQTPVVLNVPDTQVTDTFIRNGSFSSTNQDGPLLLTRSSTVPEWERRTILAFNMANVPTTTTVSSAILTLTVKSGLGTAGATRPITVYRLAAPFKEREATWKNRQAAVPWTTPGGDFGEVATTVYVSNVAGTKVSFNVTGLVQRTLRGDYGVLETRLALKDVGGGGDAKASYREYHSSEAASASDRPRLTINFGTVTDPATPPPIDVPWNGDLQQALNQVQPGGTIRLASRATYSGNFVLPAKNGTSDKDYVTITTGGVTLPTGGKPIDTDYRSLLATIKSPNVISAIKTATGASYYKIVGVAFEANQYGDGDIITLGSDAYTLLTQVPHHIVLDRILMTGDSSIGQKRGIAANARDLTIMNSDIRDIKKVGQDSQAIAAWNTPGPILIKNNYLEAAGENIMFGGTHISIPNLVPSDITIEGNVLTKNVLWRTLNWTVKNLLELKNGQRVLIRDNIFENNWAAAQNGWAIVLTPRNSSKKTPWAVVQDVEFSGNIVRHVAGVFNILGHDDTATSKQLARLLIKDNLLYDISKTWGGQAIFAQIGGEPRDITIDHNTILHTGHGIVFYLGSYINSSGVRVTSKPIQGFAFTNNFLKHNTYALFGDGKGFGTPALNYYTPGGIVKRNVFASDKSYATQYPPDNQFPTVAVFNASFQNPGVEDYRLVVGSPYKAAGLDGKDLGCMLPDWQ